MVAGEVRHLASRSSSANAANDIRKLIDASATGAVRLRQVAGRTMDIVARVQMSPAYRTDQPVDSGTDECGLPA